MTHDDRTAQARKNGLPLDTDQRKSNAKRWEALGNRRQRKTGTRAGFLDIQIASITGGAVLLGLTGPVVDFAKQGVVQGGLIDDDALRELLADPDLEYRALMADALVRWVTKLAEASCRLNPIIGRSGIYSSAQRCAIGHQ